MFLECGSCGVMWVEPMPSDTSSEDLGEHYTDVYYASDGDGGDVFEELARDVSSRRLRRIREDLGRTGRILDVGCGTGWLLTVAAEQGWEPTGVEVSPAAAQAARRDDRVTVHTGFLEQAPLETGSFDAIVASHVIEHVPDPVGMLERMRSLMTEDGVLVLALPNSRGFVHSVTNLVHRMRGRLGRDRFSCSLHPPSHLYAFDPPSIVRALSRAGFLVSRILVTGKGDPETYPMRTWKGSGRAPAAQRVIERIGRGIGRGSLLEVHARPVSRNGL